MFQNQRGGGEQRTRADRHHDRVQIRVLCQQLEAQGAIAGDRVQIIMHRQMHQTLCVCQRARVRVGRIERVTLEHHSSAIASRALELRGIGVDRKHTGALDAHLLAH